jgi:hypothetical protein
MEKVIRDGLVAVLFAPGYGAGWYSWNLNHPQCLYDPDVVAWVEGGKIGPCPDLEEKYNSTFYSQAHTQLKIVWLKVGTVFRINEYDGAETIEVHSLDDWEVA